MTELNSEDILILLYGQCLGNDSHAGYRQNPNDAKKGTPLEMPPIRFLINAHFLVKLLENRRSVLI